MHRWLSSEGMEALELDSSIETAQGSKHVKTDALDVLKLLLRRQPSSALRATGNAGRTGKGGPSATVE